MQLLNLNKSIKSAKTSPLYRELLKNVRELKSIDDLKKLPFTSKEDLRGAYPYGGLCVSPDKIVEVHTSSGTTGVPTISFYTKKDLEEGSKAIAKAWKSFGITKENRVQFIMSYGLFSGAMLNTYALQKLGAFVLPAGILPASKQIELMRDFQIDTLVATPGYLMYLSDYIKENNINRGSLKLKRAIAAGEIYSDNLRCEIEKSLNIKVYDHYGLCEVNTGIAYECDQRNGLHILDDYVVAEVVDIQTGKRVKDGVYGELVLTSLKKEASPIIRYKTGDITCVKKGLCSCGRKSIRIDRIKSRKDDLLFIKGIKVNPHELKDFILNHAKGMLLGSDIKILVKKNCINHRPIIKLSFRKEFIDQKDFLVNKIREKVGLKFQLEHIESGYFGRENSNKVKLVEFI